MKIHYGRAWGTPFEIFSDMTCVDSSDAKKIMKRKREDTNVT